MQNIENELNQKVLSEDLLNAVTGSLGRENERNVVYRIGITCVGCGNCPGFCRMNCIQEVNHTYSIDEESCIGCGICASYCPTGAIEKVFC